MQLSRFREKQHWIFRVIRKVFSYIPSSFITNESSWQWMRFYPAIISAQDCFIPPSFITNESSWQWMRFCPAIIPAQDCFTKWNQALKNKYYLNYQIWIDKNSLNTLADWYLLQKKSYQWQSPPKITIVTPVHNTDIDVLYECIISIRAQVYPYWQFILVDDGSSNIDTLDLLKSGVCKDPRIQVYFAKQSQGISSATNLAIAKSQGDYVVFLDHDDRLALDALYLIAGEIRKYPEVDIVYSDRDMISPKGKRYMHLFKPCWSPETLLTGNYIFHLMCYRRSLINQLGGLRAEFDGSQDYDLILRAAETRPQVRHIQTVLYHWRQYKNSVSLDSGAKNYAFEAGIKALNEALQRRKIAGKAVEIASLWRGNYQLDLECPKQSEIELISVANTLPVEEYTQYINQVIKAKKPYIAITSQALTPANANALGQLSAWLKMTGVALASGSIVTENNLIDYAGATYTKDGGLMIPYQGWSMSEPGYMAVTKSTRNTSAPHPFCVIIRWEVWQQLNGLNKKYLGFYSLLDFALRALAADWRCVSVPQAKFITTQQDLLTHCPEQDKRYFYKNWQDWLATGDPYYNSNLTREGQEELYQLPGT